ncbi:MAG: ABC transporter permease subunit [Alphaproteobacteria bacterium]|jgi:ABC-2 type transport system permease protein|nr:ABC transporter permease subunit [Alphaproteobacteria bacterium]
MRTLGIITRRELGGYFSTPLAYVFLVIFLAGAGAVTFYMGNFFGRRQADLLAFFGFHPWLFLVLIPAVGMRLWAEERKSGTIELLMTLPVTTGQVVAGKFLAAWAFTAIAIALTFPIWISVNYLGEPDHGVIVASYLGSLLMAGALLALTSCLSALTKNQVIAFVVGAAASFIFMMSGLDIVLGFFTDWAPAYIVDLIASMSFLTHFQTITKGVVQVPSVVFFLSMMAVCLFINVQIVELKKAG